LVPVVPISIPIRLMIVSPYGSVNMDIINHIISTTYNTRIINPVSLFY
jgi:hypothetical protein